jgi:hypothetical protein
MHLLHGRRVDRDQFYFWSVGGVFFYFIWSHMLPGGECAALQNQAGQQHNGKGSLHGFFLSKVQDAPQ